MAFPAQSYMTPSGIQCRSKSEYILILLLEKYVIPFRYEMEIKINGKKYYPDFVIMHPFTGEIILWEHIGILDDSDYAKRTLQKLAAYEQAGYSFGKTLIITYEHHLNDLPALEAFITKSFLQPLAV